MYSYVKAVKDGRLGIVSFVEEAAKIGAEGVELLDFFYQDVEEERRLTLRALEREALVCGVFSVANNFAKADLGEREVALNRIRFGVDEAGHYGAKVVRVFAGDLAADGSITFEQGLNWIIEGLAKAADYAAEKGVKLALENHGKLAGRSNQVWQIVESVREICGHDALGANPDTGNFLLVGERGDDGVRGVADLAYMVHFKDFERHPEGVYEGLDGSRFTGTVIGEGEVDLAGCVEGLRAVGFDGWVNLEYEGEGDPMVGVPRSLENARQFLNG